ncbi:uncharacterized protein LOC144100004 isoform X1 [Amblyomma americanum]
MVTLCSLLFFLISVSSITVLLLRSTFPDPSTEVNDQSDESERGPPGPAPPMAVEVPVLVDDPTKTQGPETLLCTYGARTKAGAVMAEDGLCDYAFFDSLYKDDKNTLVDHARFEQDLKTFLRAARRYTRTALGLAFAFLRMARTSTDLRQTQPSPLEEFWRLRIFHAGVLDTVENTYSQQMQEAISLLKMFHDLASARGQPTLTALALPTPHRDWATFLADQGRNLGYYPDMFVVHGHYIFGDHTVDPCAVMPPTRYSSVELPKDFFRDYRFDLESAPSGIRAFRSRNGSSRGFVSVTMKGRWTSPSSGQPFEFYSRCDTDWSAVSFGSYTEVCRDRKYAPQLRYKPDHRAVLTHNPALRRAFAYDNEQGLGTKLCKVKGEVLDLNFGIAVYDVDFDDYANECSSLNKFGSHSRLRTLRKIVDYYKSLSSDRFDEASCTSIVG